MILKLVIYLATFLLVFRGALAQCTRDPTSDCVVYDGLHVKTFDGSVYSFTSSCGYTLVSIPAVNLEVNYLKNPAALEVKYAGRIFLISISAAGVVSFTRDGVTYSVPQTLNGVSVSKPGRMVIVEIKSLGIKIRYDGNTAEVIQDNEDNFLVPSGVCGNNDGCNNNDLVMKNGQTTTSATIWVNSWALTSCSATDFANACGTNARLQAQAQNYCTNLFANTQFASCSTYSSLFTSICISNYCGCKLANRMDCMCDMLDAFVRTCQTKNNNIISWRSSTMCPIVCANPDQSYSTCAPNRKQLSCGEEEITDPSQYDCEEGCYCPAGMRLFDGRCLFNNECPCFYDGNYYDPGETIAQECNTCTCTNGQWICTTKCCEEVGLCDGDPHYITFDGLRYDFMGKCSYYVVRGIGFDVICDHYVWRQGLMWKDFQSTLASVCANMQVIADGITIDLLQNQVVRVNGREIPWVPFKAGGIRITKPSSQYTHVILRNRVTITWNGIYRASVRIPTSMKGRVNGLFGTYTNDPADDFTMPDGTLAPNANVFGHSWKVPGSCENENTNEVEHPCVTYPENRADAEQACSAITGPLFAGCSDDPVADYNDCVYDGCLCGDDKEKCLCHFYVQQGEKCAAKGINVDWRATITECAITCPADQTYQTCGNSCTRSCDDISENPTCNPTCTDGCNCPAGQTLNNQNQCVPIAQCPCVYNGVRFPPAFTFVDIENGNKHLCQNGVWVLTTATEEDIDNYPSLDDFTAACNADDFLVYAGCKATNTLTCLNKHLEQRPNYNGCTAGCECIEGFVMDTELGMCVRPEDCPCMYNGISYPDNAVISNRDEICNCVLGFWECSPQTDHWEKCSVWGDVHVRTFDQTFYSFEGYCEYILFEHVFGTGVFRVTLETSSCNTGSCIAIVYIHHRAQDGRVENVIFITGQNYMAPSNLQNLIVTNLGMSVMVDVLAMGVRVIWNKNGWAHIHVAPVWLTRESFGLCGQYDNNPSNDLEVTGQTITGVVDFVNYYQLDNSCTSSTSILPSNMLLPTDPCNYLFNDVFLTCRYLVSVNDYFNTCIMNAEQQQQLPAAQRTNHYCEVIAAYAQECNDVNVPVNWRTTEFCPFDCQANKQYYPCDTPCAQETCANTVGYENLCPDKVCAEACNVPECPAGTIYLDATYTQCVAPENCPPARRSFQLFVNASSKA